MANSGLSHNIVVLNSSTPTLLFDNPVSVDAVTGEKRDAWLNATVSVQNIDGSATVYLGNSDVTSSSYGIQLIPGAGVGIDNLSKAMPLYAISTGASSVAVMMVNR